MDYILQLLIDYKYWIVVGGALVEGEVLLLIAGMAAYNGYLSLYMVMLISFLGAVFHDHLLFFIGRFAGAKLFRRFPTIRSKSDRVFRLLHKYQNLFILGFRFVYGIRTITPIIVGTSPISLAKYSSLTVLAGIVWAVSISYLGYAFAAMISEVITYFHRYQGYLTVFVVICVLGGILIHRIKKYLKQKRLDQEEDTKNACCLQEDEMLDDQ